MAESPRVTPFVPFSYLYEYIRIREPRLAEALDHIHDYLGGISQDITNYIEAPEIVDDYDSIVFGLAINGSLVLGTNLTLPHIVYAASIDLEKSYVTVKAAPTGASIKVSIWLNATSKIQDMEVPIGSVFPALITSTSFLIPTLHEGDMVTLNVDQIGSTVAGGDLEYKVKYRVHWS